MEGIEHMPLRAHAVDGGLLARRTVTDPDTGETKTVVVPRSSVDADVLVRPSHVRRFFAGMAAHRWNRRHLPHHAVVGGGDGPAQPVVRRAHRLGHVTLPPEDGRPVAVYLMPLSDGDPVGLNNTAALIWAIAAEGEPDVPTGFAELLAGPVDTVSAEVEDYLADLVDQGLLDEVR